MNRHIVFLILGTGLCGYGLVLCLIESPDVRERAAKAPRLTCDQLIQLGPAGNSYIVLTDARLCTRGFVLERDGETGAMNEALLPIYSAALLQEPDPRDLTLLLTIHDEGEKDRLFARAGIGDLTCKVDRGVEAIQPWMRNQLTARYPGLPLRDCWTLSVGLHEPTPVRADLVLRYGIAFIVVGAIMLALARVLP